MTPIAPLLADAGFVPILIPFLGSAAVAGIFLSLAVISGGFWLLKRADPLAAAVWLKWTLILAGVAVIGGSLVISVFAWEAAEAAKVAKEWFGSLVGLVALVATIVAGIWLIRKGIAAGRPPAAENGGPPILDE